MKDTATDPGRFEDPRGFLSRHHLRPKDSFGQCFLVAEPVAAAIVAALGAREDETVIEIGTGCGTLARMIAPHARRVIAIERDRDLVAALQKDGLPDRVELVEADAAQFDYGAIAANEPTVIVGNLPYQITGKLLRAILAPKVRWRTAVVMVQKEVAARLLARPDGDGWGVLGVFTQAACTVQKITEASPRCFHPAPRVVSTVVQLTPRAEPLAEETPALQRVVHALFAARRKTVLNGLSPVANGRENAAAVLAAVGVDSRRRPETLTIEELRAISERL
ncbi:MAG: 16S rRNA (adenine(1518)-N(6)/adenine(1519)-N(6))-dimethyltransferase RsmA [Deltaproteobacteria bacterium]